MTTEAGQLSMLPGLAPVQDTEETVMSTAQDVLAMLRRHYIIEGRPLAGAFVSELQSPDGKRRADLIWMPTTMAGGNHLVGHEIKVTRADVLTELKDPTKADAWARYCTQWWLVVAHPSLVEGLDIPPQWGVMAPPSGRRTRSMTILQPAPKLQPVEEGQAVREVAKRLMYRQETEVSELARQKKSAEERAERAEAQLREAQARGGVRDSPLAKRVADIVVRLQNHPAANKLGRFTRSEELDSAIVDAIVDHELVRDVAQASRWGMENLLRQVDQLLDPLKHVREELAELPQPQLGEAPQLAGRRR